MARRRPEGIIARHSYGCPARWDVGSEKGPCRCSPRYQAQVWSPRDGKRISRTFPTQAAAKACAPRRERRTSAGQTAGRRRRQAE
jgi:hypothetical protein